MIETEMTRGGRLYVSQHEFADRMGVSVGTISSYVKTGKLTVTKFKGMRSNWLDWETQKAQYSLIQKHPNKAPKSKNGVPLKIRKTAPTAKTPEIPQMDSMEFETGEVRNQGEIIDVNTIDPYNYPDCWALDTGGEVMYNAHTGKPMMDYDKLKSYLTSLKYQLDIKQKRGELIEKSDVTFAIQDAMTIIATELLSIPRKYAEPMFAYVEIAMKQQLTTEDKQQLLEILKNKPQEIMLSVKKAFEAYLEGDN